MSSRDHQERLDRATSQRLSKLAARPVDTSHLERQMQAVLHEQEEERPDRSYPAPSRWYKPMTAMAAAVLLLGTIGWIVFGAGSTPATASPEGLATIHDEASHGLTPHLVASTIDEANRLLAEQSSGFVPLPELPGKLQHCCLHKHAGKQLTCAIIDIDSKRITVAVAESSQIQSPKGTSQVHDGRTYYIHTVKGTTLVMTSDAGRWLCVMGDVSSEELLRVAGEIRWEPAKG